MRHVKFCVTDADDGSPSKSAMHNRVVNSGKKMKSTLDVKPDPSHVRQIRVALLATALSVASPVIAQEATRLAKADVESLVVGKKLQYLSATSGETITWDSKNDGAVYFNTTQSKGNRSVRGTYTIEDDGSMCHKWSDDKYLHLQDGCVLFMRDGDRTRVVSKRNPDKLLGNLIQ